MFAAMWVLADEAAGESLGQAAPALAAMSPSAFRILCRLTRARSALPGRFVSKERLRPNMIRHRCSAWSRPNRRFVGTLVLAGRPGITLPVYWHIKSLASVPILRCRRRGLDNATGFGVPNGTRFIDAATLLKSKATDIATR